MIPSVTTIKSEPTDDNVFVLSNFEDDICVVVDFLDTSPFPFRRKKPLPLLERFHWIFLILLHSSSHDASSPRYTISTSFFYILFFPR